MAGLGLVAEARPKTGGRFGWDNLIAALIGVMDSQIASGKKYHHALLGRLTANATFADTHELDKAEQATLMMNMTTLVTDDSIDPADFVARQSTSFARRSRTSLRN